VADEGRLLVYVGRLSPVKGVEDLAKAFQMLAREDERARLVLAGDGVLKGELERWFQEWGLADRVCLTGWLSDKVLGPLYRAADAVIVPSRYEPFGMVALEAASCGALVIASRTGGLSEIIERSDGSILGAAPESPVELFGLVRRVIEDPDEARRLAERARAHVVETYSWQRVAHAVSSLLLGVVQASRRDD